MTKPELEFFDNASIEWKPVETPGYSSGCYEKILSLDEETGSLTRMIKIEPGARISGTLKHDFWEEVYIIQGELIDTGKKQVFREGYYACRPPGMIHGPFETPSGCICLEFRYFPYQPEEKQALVKDMNAIRARLDSIGYLDPSEVTPGLTFKVLKE
ncbi:hypothetical protein ES703_36588 [subsurface metagenome]